MDEKKKTVFISYCWADGTSYADDLEEQLKDYFQVFRDKTQLQANDDIYDFMGNVASCDFVVIVLTKGYVKSRNCMLELTSFPRAIKPLIQGICLTSSLLENASNKFSPLSISKSPINSFVFSISCPPFLRIIPLNTAKRKL